LKTRAKGNSLPANPGTKFHASYHGVAIADFEHTDGWDLVTTHFGQGVAALSLLA